MFFGNYNNMNMFGMNNMFNMNMFGMNNSVSQLFCGTNSVFNNCGGFNFNSFFNPMFNSGCSLFTNCNGTMNYDAMAGFGVANALFGVGGQILNQVLVNKKEDSSETIQADIKDIDAQMLEQAKKLGCSTVAEALKFTVEDKYQKDIDAVNKSISEKQSSLNSHNATLATLKGKLALASDADKSEIQTEIDKLKNETIAPLEAEIKKLKEEDFVEKQKAKSDREKEIEDVKAEIAKLQSYKANAQAMLNDKQLNSADGNKLNRTSFEELNSKFEKGSLKTGQTVSKADIRAAIKGYRTATSQEEKTGWKNKFIALWKGIQDDNVKTKDLKNACAIIAPELLN